MSKKNKHVKKDSSFSKLIGYSIVACFVLFLGSFIYQAVTTEYIDAMQRWCDNCQTYHNIDEEQENEVWCNNCQAWHAPNEESRTVNIK